MATRRRNNSQTMHLMTMALVQQPRSVAQLAEIANLSPEAVRFWLRKLKSAGGARISGYAQDARGRQFSPLWSLEGGADAPRPNERKSK